MVSWKLYTVVLRKGCSEYRWMRDSPWYP